MSFALWARAGSHLYRVTDSSIWCLADWLVFGQDEYPDRYRQAVEVAKLDYQTLRNYAWVARRFDWSRRRGTLSFQHHAEVAALSAEEQDHWLHLAEKNNWSRNKLRVNLRKHRAESEQVPPAVVLPRLPASDEQMDRWRRAAAQAGHTFSAWVVNALDAAASSTK